MWSNAAAHDDSARSFRRIRRRCSDRLARLGLHRFSSTAELCRQLSNERGRPIVLKPIPSDGGTCGLWLALPDQDLVCYDEASTGAYREHIIAHELSHIICGHHGAAAADDDTAARLFPDLDPQLVDSMLRRAVYSSVQEQEAEITASLLLQAFQHTGPRPAPERPRDPTVARIEATLTDTAGHPPERPPC